MQRSPNPDLQHHRRAWRDAKACYRSFAFIFPAALLATAAAVGGALIPESAPPEAKVTLAAGSAAGAPLVLGAIVLLILLALAPSRRRNDTHREILAKLEVMGAAQEKEASSATPIYAPGSTFGDVYFGTPPARDGEREVETTESEKGEDEGEGSGSGVA